MKKSFLVLFSLIALFITGCTTSSPVSLVVNFGNPPKGGGACEGRGICSASSANGERPNTGTTTPASTTDPTAVNVKFQVSQADNSQLTLTFSKNELMQKQPQQGQLMFQGPAASGGYVFDGPYDLTTPMFAPLNLKPGAKIDPTSACTMTVNADMVTLSYKYSHN